MGPWRSVQRVRGGDRRGQHRAHPDAARRGKHLDTEVRHFLLSAVARLPRRVITTPSVALLVSALGFAPPCAAPNTPARVAAVDLAAVAAATYVENLAALVAPSFSKAVLRLVAVADT
jgi:hypothetical protein